MRFSGRVLTNTSRRASNWRTSWRLRSCWVSNTGPNWMRSFQRREQSARTQPSWQQSEWVRRASSHAGGHVQVTLQTSVLPLASCLAFLAPLLCFCGLYSSCNVAIIGWGGYTVHMFPPPCPMKMCQPFTKLLMTSDSYAYKFSLLMAHVQYARYSNPSSLCPFCMPVWWNGTDGKYVLGHCKEPIQEVSRFSAKHTNK